jgi:hypothetical protein
VRIISELRTELLFTLDKATDAGDVADLRNDLISQGFMDAAADPFLYVSKLPVAGSTGLATLSGLRAIDNWFKAKALSRTFGQAKRQAALHSPPPVSTQQASANPEEEEEGQEEEDLGFFPGERTDSHFDEA